MSLVKIASKQRTDARKLRVAEGIAAGTSVTRLAEQEGVSRQWLSEIANCPELRQRIAQLVDARAERLDSMFDRVLDVIESGLKARDHKNASIKYQDQDGETRYFIRTYPDHYARLAAAKRFQDLLTAGRPPARPQAEKRRTFTIQEIGSCHCSSKGKVTDLNETP